MSLYWRCNYGSLSSCRGWCCWHLACVRIQFLPSSTGVELVKVSYSRMVLVIFELNTSGGMPSLPGALPHSKDSIAHSSSLIYGEASSSSMIGIGVRSCCIVLSRQSLHFFLYMYLWWCPLGLIPQLRSLSALRCQPGSGQTSDILQCHNQQCGNCGRWECSLGRIFSKLLGPAGAIDVILGDARILRVAAW